MIAEISVRGGCWCSASSKARRSQPRRPAILPSLLQHRRPITDGLSRGASTRTLLVTHWQRQNLWQTCSGVSPLDSPELPCANLANHGFVHAIKCSSPHGRACPIQPTRASRVSLPLKGRYYCLSSSSTKYRLQHLLHCICYLIFKERITPK